MSDGLTDSHWTKDMRLGGPTYCKKCGKYHPVLPFCPSSRVPKAKNLALSAARVVVSEHFTYFCPECEGWWQAGKRDRGDIVCCPHCGDPLEVGLCGI